MLSVEEFTEKYDINLDEAQKKAAFCEKRNVLILAVPGSGKTTVMIARLGYLKWCKGVSPASILAITYSVAGANEMAKRYKFAFGDDGMKISTIHSLCVSIINFYCKKKKSRPFNLLSDENAQSVIVRDIMRESGSYPTENDIKEAVTKITYCYNMMLSDDEIKEKIELEGRDFFELFDAYRRYKIENRLMDFDDQLVYALKILKSHPEIRDIYVRNYTHICVDEAQDTSKIQHEIISVLCGPDTSLFMVGDEDQSIFGFRAAYPEALMSFEADHPDSITLNMEKNYRSTKSIVSSASKFISQNKVRREKKPFSDNEEGEPVFIYHIKNLGDLPDYILEKARTEPNKKFAVLARMSDSLIPIIDVLSSNREKYYLRGRDSLFFTHYIISDIKDIIAFSENMYDSMLFSKLYYKFCCGLTKSEAERIIIDNSGNRTEPYPLFIEKSPFIPEKKRIRMHFVGSALRSMPAKNMLGKLKTIMDGTGYGEYLLQRPNDLIKMRALFALADRYSTKEAFFIRLDELEYEVKNGKSEGNIVLSTIHSVKGMEFEEVMLIDAYNGIMPSLPQDGRLGSHSSEDEKKIIEEDRRIFYVGMTRAIKKLEIIVAENNYGIPLPKSEYVQNLRYENGKSSLPQKEEKSEKEVLTASADYVAGKRINHKTFGYGTIITVNEKSKTLLATVIFDEGGTKKLSLYDCIKKDLTEIIDD